jgi:hypothetical protein
MGQNGADTARYSAVSAGEFGGACRNRTCDLLRVDQRRGVPDRPARSTEAALTRRDAPPTSSAVQPDPNELAVKRAVKTQSSGAVTRPRFATQPRSRQRRTNASKSVIAMRRKRPVRTVGNSPSLSSS